MVSQFGIFTLLPFMVATGVSAGRSAIPLDKANPNQIRKCMDLASTLNSKTWWSYDDYHNSAIKYYQFSDLRFLRSTSPVLGMTMRMSQQYTRKDEESANGIYMPEEEWVRYGQAAKHELKPTHTIFEALEEQTWIVRPKLNDGEYHCELWSPEDDRALFLYSSQSESAKGEIRVKMIDADGHRVNTFAGHEIMPILHEPQDYRNLVQPLHEKLPKFRQTRKLRQATNLAVNAAIANPVGLFATGVDYFLN